MFVNLSNFLSFWIELKDSSSLMINYELDVIELRAIHILLVRGFSHSTEELHIS